MSPSVTEETITCLPLRTWLEKVEVEVWTWVLELECAKTDEQRRKKAWIGR